jgi:hypothetical protein
MKNFEIKDLMISVNLQLNAEKAFINEHAIEAACLAVSCKATKPDCMAVSCRATKPDCMAVSCKATKPIKKHHGEAAYSADLLNLKKALVDMQAQGLSL